MCNGQNTNYNEKCRIEKNKIIVTFMVNDFEVNDHIDAYCYDDDADGDGVVEDDIDDDDDDYDE